MIIAPKLANYQPIVGILGGMIIHAGSRKGGDGANVEQRNRISDEVVGLAWKLRGRWGEGWNGKWVT